MKLTLKSFSQEVVLANKDEVKYYAHFLREDGKELKLPITKEGSETLIRFTWDRPEPEKTAEAEEPEREEAADATEFGGDEVPEEEPAEDVQEPEEESLPESEEEVPSL